MLRAIPIGLVLAAGGLQAQAATIVVNGSFEAPAPGDVAGVINGADYDDMPVSGPSTDRWPTLEGWRTIRGAGIEVMTGRTLPGISAQDGAYFVELDNGNNVIEQRVSLGVGDYLLSFWYSPRVATAGANGISYLVSDLLTGTVNGPGGALGTVLGEWTEITARFSVLTEGSYRLRFAGIGTGDSAGGLIDNVSISPVPVPAAGMLLIGALGGLAALKRRRTAAV